MSDSPEPSDRVRLAILTVLSFPTAAELTEPLPDKDNVSPLTRLLIVDKSLAEALLVPSYVLDPSRLIGR